MYPTRAVCRNGVFQSRFEVLWSNPFTKLFIFSLAIQIGCRKPHFAIRKTLIFYTTLKKAKLLQKWYITLLRKTFFPIVKHFLIKLARWNFAWSFFTTFPVAKFWEKPNFFIFRPIFLVFESLWTWPFSYASSKSEAYCAMAMYIYIFFIRSRWHFFWSCVGSNQLQKCIKKCLSV